MTEKIHQEELMDLANRMIQLRYSMDSDHLGLVFSEVSMADYMILAKLARKMNLHDPDKKVYLREISSEMNLSITMVSKLVQQLQNEGYVYWKHDEDGSNGTYIYLSETGEELMGKQQQILNRYFKNIIERIGYDRFVQVLDLMGRLEVIMEEEAEKLSPDMN